MKKVLIITALLGISIPMSLFSNNIDTFTQMLSIDRVINTKQYNLSAIRKYEGSTLKMSKEEQLTHISTTTAAYILRFLDVDVTDESSNIDNLLVYNVLNDGYYDSVWASYGHNLPFEEIIDKAQNYENFSKLEINNNIYYSFQIRNKKSGDLYSPLYLYVNTTSLIVTDFEDNMTAILTNEGKNNYWNKGSKGLLYNVNIIDFEQYREYGEGIIASVDFDNGFKFITSSNTTITKTITGKINYQITFSADDAEKAQSIKATLEELKLDVIDKVARIKNNHMDNFCNAVNISSKKNTVTVETTIPKEIFDILRFNLISSFTDLLEVYPELYYDFGEDEEYEVDDVLLEDAVEYRESYQYRSDFTETEDSNARFETNVQISEIGYLEDSNNLYIKVKLTPMVDKELDWQYRYLDFGIRHVSTKNGYIEFPEDIGTAKLPESKNVGEFGTVEQTIILPEGYKHQDITEIITEFSFLEPQIVTKKVLTKADIGNTLKIGSGYFTLLGLENPIIYNYVDLKDSLIEVRGLNSKGEALYSAGSGHRTMEYNNGLKAGRYSKTMEGNLETAEIYYVEQFNHIPVDLPHKIYSDFSQIDEKDDSNRSAFAVTEYNPGKRETLPIDDFFETGIENWPLSSAGPFDVYLRGLSDMWELETELYIKAPNHPAFKESLSCFELIIDEVTTNSGEIISRPDKKTLETWEEENNTFRKTFSWHINGPLYSRGDMAVLRQTLTLGITSNYGGLDKLKGHIEFNIPKAVTTIDVEKLYVGSIIETDNIKLEVVKFIDGYYHIKILKGSKNIVEVRAKDPKDNNYKILYPKIDDQILLIEPISRFEIYEFTVATENQSYRYDFTLEP